MKKIFLLLLFLTSFLFYFPKSVNAVYDPLTKPNNIAGIHILFPNEIAEAAKLVNSSGGDWGYITIPIQTSDKNLDKWQSFMDEARKFHLIPIIRLATDGDYFNTTVWAKPNYGDVLDFANFLNSLNWPTKNRYIVVFNEPNRGDEWGGSPNASEYADILNYALDVFKKRSDEFFILSAGLDNASINVDGKSLNEYTFIREMNSAVPEVFTKIDGIASHSYPNPGFSAPPSYAYEGVYSFKHEQELIESLSGKKLPVFITETGWSSDTVSGFLQESYYKDAFSNYWSDKNVIAVTPFLLRAGMGPFTQFSFLEAAEKSGKYKAYQNIAKEKGSPDLNNYPLNQNATVNTSKLPIDKLFKTINQKYTITVSKPVSQFLKWLLKI